MDAYERQAKSMERAQDLRLRKAPTLDAKVQFWTPEECETYQTIQRLREKSKTYTGKTYISEEKP